MLTAFAFATYASGRGKRRVADLPMPPLPLNANTKTTMKATLNNLASAFITAAQHALELAKQAESATNRAGVLGAWAVACWHAANTNRPFSEGIAWLKDQCKDEKVAASVSRMAAPLVHFARMHRDAQKSNVMPEDIQWPSIEGAKALLRHVGGVDATPTTVEQKTFVDKFPAAMETARNAAVESFHQAGGKGAPSFDYVQAQLIRSAPKREQTAGGESVSLITLGSKLVDGATDDTALVAIETMLANLAALVKAKRVALAKAGK